MIYTLNKPNQSHFRIGLSVSKKIGNAVTRNQIKRYVRQTFHELDGQLHNETDYIIIARKPTAEMDFFEVKKSLTCIATGSCFKNPSLTGQIIVNKLSFIFILLFHVFKSVS